MLIVLSIMTTVMAGLTTLFVQGSNAELDMNNRFQAQLNARLALDKVRREIHCGSVATPAGQASLIVVTLPSYCKTGSGSITWCTKSVATNRFALYRITGAPGTCTGGVKWADYLDAYDQRPRLRRRTLHLHVHGAVGDQPREDARRLPRQRQAGEDGRAVRAPGRHRPAEQQPLLMPADDPSGGGADPRSGLRQGVMFLRRRIQLVQREGGFALVMALGMMVVLSAMVVTAVTYSTSNTTETTQSRSRNDAFGLAEAGINNAMAVPQSDLEQRAQPQPAPEHDELLDEPDRDVQRSLRERLRRLGRHSEPLDRDLDRHLDRLLAEPGEGQRRTT